MLSFEAAAKALDRAAEDLPQGIFDDLNGGINLLDEVRRSDDGRYIMGLYHHNSMGRYVEIFYGSFAEVYGNAPDKVIENELKKTLYHELTHHIENKAGDRSLERWDEEQTEKWLQSRQKEEDSPMEVESLLFIGDAGDILAGAAQALFDMCCDLADYEPLECASAGLGEPEEAIPIEALRAAKNEGIDLSFFSDNPSSPVSRELLEDYDVFLCLNVHQAQALSQMFPDLQERIMCLGRRDIAAPRLKSGWAKVMHALHEEIQLLTEEMYGEDDDYDYTACMYDIR